MIQAMVLVVMTLHLSVSVGANPINCHCNKFKTFCIFAKFKGPTNNLPTSTERLRIEGSIIKQLNSSSIITLNSLKTLELVNVHLEEISAPAFRQVKKLESLTISHNNLLELESDLFVGLGSLIVLNLSHNRLVSLHSGVFEGLGRLRHLDLSHNLFEDLHSGMFDGLRQEFDCEPSKITSKLDLSFNPITRIDIGAFDGLCRFTRLEMSNHKLSVVEANVFLGLGGLRTLNLYLGAGGNISKNALCGLKRLVELNIWTSGICFLGKSMLRDSTRLELFDVSYNNIEELEAGAFANLFSLRSLLLNHNRLRSLKNFVFEDLKSLRNLNLSRNIIKTIEPFAFQGMTQLRCLDLRRNGIRNLMSETFSGLVTLRELFLQENNKLLITSDSSVFLGLPFLKCLYLNNALRSITGDLTRLTISRLDILDGSSKLLENLQVVKLLDLSFTMQENVSLEALMTEQLNNIHFVQKLHVTVLLVTSTTDLQSLVRFNITSLRVRESRIKILESNGFKGFSNVGSLSLAKCHIKRIERRAFHGMIALRELDLCNNRNLTLEVGSFEGLCSLENLNLYDSSVKHVCAKTFEGLQGLKKLNLQLNYISSLKPGVFQALHSIVEIDLSWNRISNLSVGVFGAICRDDFAVTCENLTYLNQYCNETFSLKTLQHLDLSMNAIEYIHSHAFVSCSSLQTLKLRANNFKILHGNDFLYTPRLMVLDLNSCNLSAVRNTTFMCTPQLSHVDLGDNEIEAIPVNTVQHLKKLKVIKFEANPIVCDCEFYLTWQWLRRYHVQYIENDMFNYYDNICNGSSIDRTMSSLQCNASEPNAEDKTKAGAGDFSCFVRYIEPIVFILLFACGLSTNGLLTYIILRYCDKRTETEVFMIHLAVVDMLSLILNLPLSYWEALNVTWDLGFTMCRIFVMSKELTVGLTVYSLVVLSLGRFIVISASYSLKGLNNMSETMQATQLLVSVWALSISISLPSFFAATLEDRCLICKPEKQQTYIKYAWLFQLVVYCLVPAATIACFNIIASCKLKKSVREMPGEIKVTNVRAQSRNRAANMICALVFVFIVSYAPHFLLRVLVAWSIFRVDEVFLVSFFFYCLFFCNTIFNPIALFCMSKNFKSHALLLFRSICGDRHADVQTHAPSTEDVVFRASTNNLEDDQIRRARMQRIAELQKRFK